MENVFYVVLALHMAGKPINEDTIRKTLNMAGVPVDEEELKAMAAFVHVLQAPKEEKVKVDERIIKFLGQELSYLKGKTEKLTLGLAPFLEKIEKGIPTQEESELPKVKEEKPVVREETKPSVHQVKEEKPPTREEVKPPVEQAMPAAPAGQAGARSQVHDEPEPGEQGDGGGRYLYCVTEGSERINLGKIGIEGNEVYTIPCRDLCAVVHNCGAEPYKSDDQEEMKTWAITHNKVIETAWERFGTVLPLGFDTIIKGEEGIAPDENMKKWLKDDYENLRPKLAKLKDTAEYGVQVFWAPKIISEGLIETNPEIKKLSEEIKSKPKGVAHMYKQKLENLLKKEMEEEADRYFKDFYERIKGCVDEIKVEKTKKPEEDKQMLMNFSCLLPKEKSERLGEELEKINNMEGFFVRFTGPWPPYGFV